MLAFYLDEAMTRRITTSTPKRFLAPTAGYVKYGTVYIGDPYSVTVINPASIGATVLSLTDASEFINPTSGSATAIAYTSLGAPLTITYTGILGTTLTGVSGITSALTIGCTVVPSIQWDDSQPIIIYPEGAQVLTLGVSLRLSGSSSFSFPGMPLIISPSIISLSTPLAIDVQVNVPPGTSQEFTQWRVSAGPFYQEPIGVSTPGSGVGGITAVMSGYVNQADQALPVPIRVLPLNRQLNSPTGFIVGEYRWRDDTEINAQTIIPTNWNTDPTSMSDSLFIPGVGARSDLQPLGFVQNDNSIYLQINRGYYYTGAKQYYLPATPELDSQDATQITFAPVNTPEPTLPIFIGNYVLDSQGFYEWNQVYRYQTQAAISRNGSLGTPLPAHYFTWNPVTSIFTLNTPLSVQTLNLGFISGNLIDYFNVPIYPILGIQSMYVLKPDGSHLIIHHWTLDTDNGTVQINGTGSGPSVTGAVQGEIVIAVCEPGLTVLFDTTNNPVRTLGTLDLNPAFSGISGGIVYLQHSVQDVATITLGCDKPLIPIPATYSSIIGLIAYGPIYFNGDYALLQATAYNEAGEIIQGASLQVIANPSTFTGTINYLDPLTETIIVKTGADGIANMVFRPAGNYGYWIPTSAPSGSLAGITTTNISNDTLVLPTPVPISQLYAPTETQPFLITAYSVLNNNPVLGKVGATVLKGEVAWTTTGTPGTSSYKTNGQYDVFLNSSDVLYPIDMRDSTNTSYLSLSFNGTVVSIIYGQALPTDGTVGAYFVTFVQRTLLQMQAVDSNVLSNSILLQMQEPQPINNNLWLILNDQYNGILNQYRLGWTLIE